MDLTRLRKIHDELGAIIAEADAVEAAKPIVVTVWADDCPENPSTEDGWTPYSFSTRHENYRDPSSFGKGKGALDAKLANGLAFQLSYFEHGLCTWSIAGEGPQCRWDNVDNAGILIWEQPEDNIGAKTVEERRKDAALFLENYTRWCNGHVYGFTIESPGSAEGDPDYPSCGGFYDFGSMVGAILDHVDIEDLKRVTFKGEASFGIADEWKEALSTILSRNTAKA